MRKLRSYYENQTLRTTKRAKKLYKKLSLDESWQTVIKGNFPIMPSDLIVRLSNNQIDISDELNNMLLHKGGGRPMPPHLARPSQSRPSGHITGVRDALGHASLETTNRYAHGTEDRKRLAVEAQEGYLQKVGNKAEKTGRMTCL
jgi:hypothetical protein